MKRLACVMAMAGLLAACGPSTEIVKPKDETAATAPAAAEIAALPDPQGACAAQTTYSWKPPGGAAYEVTGAAGGPTCQSGTAVITIRNPESGKVLLSESVDVDVMTNTVFADSKSPTSLKRGLDDWIRQTADDTTATLPEWAAGAEMPMQGEFAFYPEEGTTRAAYASLKTASLPIFCFVQGGESLACFALDRSSDTLKKIGLQTFPG